MSWNVGCNWILSLVPEYLPIIQHYHATENKAVLETIRNLTNYEWMVPDWLHDVFLGYGELAI